MIEVERGEADIDELVGEEERAISVITVSELLHGVYRSRGARRARRRAVVEGILAAFEPVPITDAVARLHAEVWVALARRGEMIGAHDLWIAATALTHGLRVATRSVADFSRVPGVRVVG